MCYIHVIQIEFRLINYTYLQLTAHLTQLHRTCVSTVPSPLFCRAIVAKSLFKEGEI